MENRKIIVEKKLFKFDKGRLGYTTEYLMVKFAKLNDGVLKFETHIYRGREVEESDKIGGIYSINDYEIDRFLTDEKIQLQTKEYSETTMNVLKQLLSIPQILNNLELLKYKLYNRQTEGTMKLGFSSNYKYSTEHEYLDIIIDKTLDSKSYLKRIIYNIFEVFPEKWISIEENNILFNVDKDLKFCFKEIDFLDIGISKNNACIDNILKDEGIKRFNMYTFKTTMSSDKFNTLDNNLYLPLYSNLDDNHNYVVLFFFVDNNNNVFQRQRIYTLLRQKLEMKLKVIRRNADGFEILVGEL